MNTQNNTGILITRVVIAVLMLFHGFAKLGGIDPIKGMLVHNGLPELMAYGVYITEILAPILILIGWRTRVAAIIFLMGMISALFLAHSGDIFALSKTGGLQIELILLYASAALSLVFTGAGKYAISTSNRWD
ncbi:DoxX family protein [Labilibaculum sp.]|uniref:DoxX family protein n=1 Tax=Labilibaculum sp. TaxID=2060723 RepID=UPI00356943D3